MDKDVSRDRSRGQDAFRDPPEDLDKVETRKSILELAALESSILDAVPQAIVGLHNRLIIFANNAVKDTFGWDREELIGRNVNLFYRNDREANDIADYFYSTLAHQRTFVNDFCCRHKDGRDILCRMRAARIGEELSERRIVITYEDITEKIRAEKELQQSREQLRNLSIHLQTIREKESARIAREIHDELGQSLTALQMDISWLGGQLPERCAPLREKTHRMSHLVDTTIDSVHRIMAELRPTLLDDLGLTAAIEWLSEDFHNRSGIQCDVYVDCRDSSIGKDLATNLFRILQETLTNVARHAQASMVCVRLIQDSGEIILEVVDNGKGITRKQAENARSFGILGIRERVNLMDGTVRITGRCRRGTRVKVVIPMERGAI
ncbi:MAG TPA: PAS domain-containing sensor histidine kinase [Deltaproteobacteria bacterium]|nr:PAS domain-containing sensor histidine kinase [Deltaproteobacteria bacterium]HPR54489.1 PAS domain-containing sensor histidine kinase [Deltaproteobacteria bacterium]HXK46597.1 PAS domain-containing sensor histidine kinase [Deltaproteobacteria bacterium]